MDLSDTCRWTFSAPRSTLCVSGNDAPLLRWIESPDDPRSEFEQQKISARRR